MTKKFTPVKDTVATVMLRTRIRAAIKKLKIIPAYHPDALREAQEEHDYCLSQLNKLRPLTQEQHDINEAAYKAACAGPYAEVDMAGISTACI